MSKTTQSLTCKLSRYCSYELLLHRGPWRFCSVPTCTNILLAQMQVCPAFLKADDTTPAAAWSMSASSNTMKGALPPSSSETCKCAIAVCQVNWWRVAMSHSLSWPASACTSHAYFGERQDHAGACVTVRTFLTVSAAAAKSSLPILVEPVNPIFRTASDSIRVSPAQHDKQT